MRWTIFDSLTNKTLAYTKKLYPVGLAKWYFINESCSDDGMDYRTLNFHPFVEQPGYFCCNDGVCIDVELVCDGSLDCADGGDELKCKMIETYKNYDKSKGPQKIFVNLNILDLLTIDESHSSFELYFWLKIKVDIFKNRKKVKLNKTLFSGLILNSHSNF